MYTSERLGRFEHYMYSLENLQALAWAILNNSFCGCHTHKKLFSGDQYQDDINTENPLGTGGKLAVIFANLMRNLWSGKERSLSPYKLKVRMHEANGFVIY